MGEGKLEEENRKEVKLIGRRRTRLEEVEDGRFLRRRKWKTSSRTIKGVNCFRRTFRYFQGPWQPRNPQLLVVFPYSLSEDNQWRFPVRYIFWFYQFDKY